MSIINLSPSQLRKAASLKEKIATLEKQLAQLEGTKVVSAPASKPVKKKGGMSAAGRARVAAAQKARWAKIKAAKAKPAAKKKKISAAGIAKIKAAQKARWAKIKAEKAEKKD
jgi:hypothetical protein